MSGICAIWPVRFPRVKRKDVPSLTTGSSTYSWGPAMNSMRSPVFWIHVGMGDRPLGEFLSSCSEHPWAEGHPSFVQPQLCFLREAMAGRAVFTGLWGHRVRGASTGQTGAPHLVGSIKHQETGGVEPGHGGKNTHTVRQQKQLPGAPSAHPGLETGPRVSGGHILGRGYSQGTGPVCRAGSPGRDRCWTVKTAHFNGGRKGQGVLHPGTTS